MMKGNMMPLKHRMHDPIPAVVLMITFDGYMNHNMHTKSSDTHPVMSGPVAAPVVCITIIIVFNNSPCCFSTK